MADSFSSLSTLDFSQKRDLLQLLATVIDAARAEAARQFDAGNKSDKLAVITDSIGLEALYHEIKDRRLALERDRSIPVTDLIEPALRYCKNKLS